ncbi:flavodoxin family protein [Eubacteriales bacterium OttesenSCG-928-M02]|nr:flavodoxin family protein [Eubacteriales bacterium OttesenSCG-928-M02]
MAVLVLWASPNKDGLTAACKDAALLGISQAGKMGEAIPLNEYDIQRCWVCNDGYGICREGKCIIQDDLMRVYDAMVAAEGIILITPVYWHDLSEPLKTLLDRIRRMETRQNHALENKKCLLVAAAGGTGNGVVRCLEQMEHALGNMKAEVRDRLPITRFSRAYMLPAIKEAAAALCQELG